MLQCARLADLALLTLIRTDDGGAIVLHDVIREYLREELGPARLAQANRALIATAAADLPSAAAIDASRGQGTVTAWWQLPEQAPYMRDHLIEHMLAAEHQHDAEAVACDLRWVGSRLEQTGPAAPFADLGLAGTDRTERLGRLFGQAAHLLAPTDPPHSRIDILYSRISHDPDWGAQAQVLAAGRKLPALLHHWPLPDLPDPAQRRTMSGHTDCVTGVAVAPDGTWLATGGIDDTARIWDTATGQQRAILTGHARWVNAVAIAPDGMWLATASSDGTARIWDTATGEQRAMLIGHTSWVNAVAIAPDGTWLATGGADGTTRIWHTETGEQLAVLPGDTEWVLALAVAPDGTWLATGGRDRVARIWETATWRERATLPGHNDEVRAIAIAPDGTWLATGGEDGTARIWDTATGQQRMVLSGHAQPVRAVAIAPDGGWLATGGRDGTARICGASRVSCTPGSV